MMGRLLLLLTILTVPRLKAQDLPPSLAPQSGATQPATSQPASPQAMQLEIPANKDWTETNVDVHSGDVLAIAPKSTPQNCPLYARVGSTGQVFRLGLAPSFKAPADGRLFLGSNTSNNDSCKGDFSALVQVTPAKTGMSMQQKLANAAQTWLSGQFGTQAPTSTQGNSAAAGQNTTNPVTQIANLVLSKTPLDPALTKDIDALPRRVADEFKNQGDMVNFVMVGSEQEVQKDLADANWHLADTNNAQAVVNAISQIYKKEDYIAMPMSQLMLFGRFQDFGYEQADPFAVVASRHHFRLWKAPFDYKGQTVWVGAGTHDIGFEKDQRNGKVTHKIDPNVDSERDHIAATLQQAGKVAGMSYYLPSNPVQDAKNATGGGYRSDGRIIVMFLK